MKKIFFNSFIFLFLSYCSIIQAEEYELKSQSLVFQFETKTGGIQSVVNEMDKYRMNWIIKSDSMEYPWQTASLSWGLGKGKVNGEAFQWIRPASYKQKNKQITFVYEFQNLKIVVDRFLNKSGNLTESFRFVNTSDNTIQLSELGIYTPFNDNYPDAKTCVESRCNAHIWAGGNASYVFAERMGGEAPHLGLVVKKGSLKSYEILNRNINKYSWDKSGSNVRGTIVLNPSDFRLLPGKTYTLQWVIFPANDKNDFFAKAKQNGFVKATASKYVLQDKEPLVARFESSSKLRNVQCFLNGEKVSFTQKDKVAEVNLLPGSFGNQELKLIYNNHSETFLNVFRIKSADSLLLKRAAFIVKNQQMNEVSDPRYGAYMVYDNELRKIYLNDDKRQTSDVNEGRERVGMGVFIARLLQIYPNQEMLASLLRYVDFVKNKLQRPDYSVPSGIDGKGHVRVYNYPWVAQLYLEIYKLTSDKKFLVDSYKTLDKYFIESKHNFYAIGVPFQEALEMLKQNGMNEEYNILLEHCILTASHFLQNSIYYPKSEVNYEQSIVGPAVIYLLEMYEITKDKKYLLEGEKQLAALESFSGMQPDYHLNEIAIRHWDGYWFGKREFWGDTMPHYWSTITAEAYLIYARITGKKEYQQRAETIVLNNLCQFFEDGSASCAYVYPSKVNGQIASFFDPFANDQDWALVYYLKIMSERD